MGDGILSTKMAVGRANRKSTVQQMGPTCCDVGAGHPRPPASSPQTRGSEEAMGRRYHTISDNKHASPTGQRKMVYNSTRQHSMEESGTSIPTTHTALTTSSTSTTEGPGPPAPAFQAPPPADSGAPFPFLTHATLPPFAGSSWPVCVPVIDRPTYQTMIVSLR